MERNIFLVLAAVVDANGTFTILGGYPKAFDSKNYNNDIAKARQRAYGDYHEVLGSMCKADTRQEQIAMLIDIGNCITLEETRIGEIADLPESEE